MSKISIIGTSGAGKTVFITVLAERYSKRCSGMPWLEYQNAETKIYSSRVWGTLNDDQDWPPSTPAGTLPSLEWKMYTPHGGEYEMRVLDAPGQDIQAIYMVGEGSEELTEGQEFLKNNIEDADILVLLVNLCDVIKAKTHKEKTNFEVPIVMAARNALTKNARVAVLFTQHDQLRALFEEKGIEENDYKSAIQEFLPGLSGVLNLSKNVFFAGFVAAVAETEPYSYQDSSGEWRTISRPKKNFTSEGLEEFMGWLASSLHVEQQAINKKERDEKLKNVAVATVVMILIFVFSFLITQFIFEKMMIESIPEKPYIPDFVLDKTKAWNEMPFRYAPKGTWSWNIDEEFIGADNIILINKGSKTWLKVELEIFPENRQDSITCSHERLVQPNEEIKLKAIHNFRYKGGSARCKISTEDDYQESAQRQIWDYENKKNKTLIDYETTVAKIEAQNKENGSTINIISYICSFGLVGVFVFKKKLTSKTKLLK